MINFPSRTKFILHFEQAVSVSQSDVMPQAFEFRIFSRGEKKKFGNYILHTYFCPFSFFPFLSMYKFFFLNRIPQIGTSNIDIRDRVQMQYHLISFNNLFYSKIKSRIIETIFINFIKNVQILSLLAQFLNTFEII